MFILCISGSHLGLWFRFFFFFSNSNNVVGGMLNTISTPQKQKEIYLLSDKICDNVSGVNINGDESSDYITV